MDHLHTFEGGMDQDTTAFKYPKNKYYEATNMRLTVDEENQQYSLATIDGSETYFGVTSYAYKGHCFIREKLVLFLKHTAGTTDLILEIDPMNITYGTGTDLDISDPVFSGNLDFRASDDILSTTPAYESSTTRKIYFSDGVNPIRVLHLSRDYTGYTADDLNVLPPSEHAAIAYTDIEEGGQIVSGMVQYTYMLYNKNGAETYFAPLSTILPITKGPIHSPTNYKDRFRGGIKEQACDKSVKFTISTDASTDKFDYIKVVGVYYEDKDIDPTIKVLGDFPFISSTMEFLDSGAGYSDEYTVTEFNALKMVFAAGSIENKVNHLFAADITEDIFDVEYDARTYRFADSGTNAGQAKIFQADGSYFIVCRAGITRPGAGGIAALGDWVYYSAIGNYQSSHPDYDQSGYGTNFSIPEIADAICPENDLSEDFTPTTYVQQEHYYYTSESGTTYGVVGGSGLNVSYTITAHGLHEEYNDDDTTLTQQDLISGSDGYKRMYQYENASMSTATEGYMLGTVDNYASPIRASVDRSFQRDEIYRFGVIFIDKFGRTSYVKWIGDIRMPKAFDYYDNSGSQAYYYLTASEWGTINKVNFEFYTVRRIKIEFEITNVTDPDVAGFQIVAVERNSANSTIVDSGWMGSLDSMYGSGYSVLGFGFPTSLVIGDFGTTTSTINTAVQTNSGNYTSITNLSDSFKEYISPDINFSNGDVPTTPTKFYCYGSAAATASSFSYHTLGGPGTDTVYFKQYGTNTNSYYTSAHYSEFDIDSFAIFSDLAYNAGNDEAAYNYTMGSTTVWNFSKGGASYGTDISNAGARGTCGIVYGTPGIDYATNTNAFKTSSLYEAIYVSRKNMIDPYGGLTYVARQISEYSPVSPFEKLSSGGSGTVEATGDTYIGLFEHIRTMVSDNTDISDGGNNIEVLYLPVESRYNVVARSSYSYYNLYDEYGGIVHSILGIKETPGAWAFDNYSESTWNQNFYLYDYNNTYNRISNIQRYTVAPLGYEVGETYRNDTRIVVSEEKENGELIDSWTKFLFANELELKTEYGPIVNIDLVGDNLIALQEKAVASIAVRDREQITGDSGAALTLGTGEILERYDYVSTTTGCQSKKGHVVTPTGLYFYDGYNKGIFGLSAKGEPSISKAAFMDSFFKNISYSDFDIICTGYDRSHNDVLFTFDMTGVVSEQKTLSFNDIRGYFTHFMTTDRVNYIYDDRILLSIDDNDTYNTFYKANIDDSLTLDGNEFDCSVTIISRPEHPDLSRFDYLVWNSIVKNATTGVEEVDSTFTTIRSTNTYQDTGILSKSLFKRKMRNWRLNSFRDNTSVRGNLKPRLRSEWLKTIFTFSPYNNKLWIDAIKVIFTPNKV